MKPPHFSPLSESEIRWKSAQLAAARKIVMELSPSDSWDPIRPEALDRAWGSWLAKGETNNQAINDHINAFGIAFGETLIESGVFSWTIVSDEYGTDLGILALPSRGDVSVVPASFVAKRWDRKVVDFMVDGHADILAHVEKTKLEWNEAGK